MAEKRVLARSATKAKKDHSRIRYQRVSEATGKEVPAEEIVRGFEVERDNFVVISDDELKEAAPEKSAAIRDPGVRE